MQNGSEGGGDGGGLNLAAGVAAGIACVVSRDWLGIRLLPMDPVKLGPDFGLHRGQK